MAITFPGGTINTADGPAGPATNALHELEAWVMDTRRTSLAAGDLYSTLLAVVDYQGTVRAYSRSSRGGGDAHQDRRVRRCFQEATAGSAASGWLGLCLTTEVPGGDGFSVLTAGLDGYRFQQEGSEKLETWGGWADDLSGVPLLRYVQGLFRDAL